jgi:hypothetical protein
VAAMPTHVHFVTLSNRSNRSAAPPPSRMPRIPSARSAKADDPRLCRCHRDRLRYRRPRPDRRWALRSHMRISSCPDLIRASTPCRAAGHRTLANYCRASVPAPSGGTTWMAGSSPAMTTSI